MATEPQRSSRIANSKTPITRDTFIAPDYVRRALVLKTMLTYDDEGELKEVRIPAKFRKAGALPKGYAVGSSNPHDLMMLVNAFSDL
jgi:hypothetical protein